LTVPYFGEVYLAVASPAPRACVVVAFLAVAEGGQRKIDVETTPSEMTVPQATAWGLQRALERLGGRRASLHTNLKAAVDLMAGSPLELGEDFRGLMGRVRASCETTGSAVVWCRSSEEPMALVRRKANEALTLHGARA